MKELQKITNNKYKYFAGDITKDKELKSLKLKGLNILNVGTSKETTILQIARIISNELKSNKKIVLKLKKCLKTIRLFI